MGKNCMLGREALNHKAMYLKQQRNVQDLYRYPNRVVGKWTALSVRSGYIFWCLLCVVLISVEVNLVLD